VYPGCKALNIVSNSSCYASADPECEVGDERINAEGIVRLFEDLNVDPEDVRVSWRGS